MKRLSRRLHVLVSSLAMVLGPVAASAQGDTLSISGTFDMDQLSGTVGSDLAAVFSRGHEHWWSLTLHGVTYSHAEIYNELGYSYDEQLVTRVRATSFDFQFFGPDAAILDDVVGRQLTKGGLGDGVFLELRNVYIQYSYYYYYYYYYGGEAWYSSWDVGLSPPDSGSGISLRAGHGYLGRLFATGDALGHPAVKPQLLPTERSVIADRRPGSSGEILSFDDRVEIGSSGPPALPALSIGDASVVEGNRGSKLVIVRVTLSPMSFGTVTVGYETAGGTAQADRDYYPTRGTLNFGTGETQRAIEVRIRSERKPERNETFTVRLSNATGATIADAVGSVTILNDD